MSKHLLSFYWLSFLSIILCVCVSLLSVVPSCPLCMCPCVCQCLFDDSHPQFQEIFTQPSIPVWRGVEFFLYELINSRPTPSETVRGHFFIANNLKWANCAQECIFRLIRLKVISVRRLFGGHFSLAVVTRGLQFLVVCDICLFCVSQQNRVKHPAGSEDEEWSGVVCAGPAGPAVLSFWAGKEETPDFLLWNLEYTNKAAWGWSDHFVK